MAENTKIEWADHTFNAWLGCQKVSPACDNCYAENWAERFGQVEWGPKAERKRTSRHNWAKPIKWNNWASKNGQRQRVFCASLADVFDNRAPEGTRDDLWSLIRSTRSLDWLLLTKRPQNIVKMLPDDWGPDGYPNVWLGTTVENQEEAERRIPHLLAAPAPVHFLSCEPLLGHVDLSEWLLGDPWRGRINLVIAGGESGPGARPTHPDWQRSLRDQCGAAGVAFHFKQWGEWLPWEADSAPYFKSQNGEIEDGHTLFPSDFDNDSKWDDGLWGISDGLSHAAFQRVGKGAAGRQLDGRTWDEMPGSRGARGSDVG